MNDRPATSGGSPVAVRITAVLMLLMGAWVAWDLQRTLIRVADRPHHRVDSIRLDPRQATAAELTLVPGIGPATAARIVEHRRSHGRDALLAGDAIEGRRWDLEVVPGVGPVTARRAARYLRHPNLPSPRRSGDRP